MFDEQLRAALRERLADPAPFAGDLMRADLERSVAALERKDNLSEILLRDHGFVTTSHSSETEDA